MKKIIALLLTVALLAMPALAGWEEDANIGNVKYTIEKYAEKPVLDGVLDEYGYTKLPVAPGDISYAWDDGVDDGSLAKALSFDAYVSYDENNLYFFIRNDASHYFNDYDDGNGDAWQASGVQISAGAQDAEGGDRLEYGIWRNSETNELGSVIWAQHPFANAEFEPAGDVNYTVRVADGNIYYEGVVPVDTFLEKASVAQGDVVAFSIVMVQSQKDNPGYIHTQIASGCTGNGKTAENFMRLTLGGTMAGRPADPEPEPEAVGGGDSAPEQPVVAAPSAPAPKTGDAGMIVLIALMAVAALGVVILRKRAAK